MRQLDALSHPHSLRVAAESVLASLRIDPLYGHVPVHHQGLPLGLLGSNSAKTTFLGTSKCANCAHQCAATFSPDRICPGTTTITAVIGSAVLFRPQTSHYEDVVAEAAAPMETRAIIHPLIDDNKRSTLAAAD